MKALFENSLFVRLLMCLRAWYHEGAIAGFFEPYPAGVPKLGVLPSVE